MAGRGPAPKLQHQRERDTRRRQSGEIVVVPDGRTRGPRPDPSWGPAATEWYAVWRRAAQAQLFEETDWAALRLLAPLVDAHALRPSAAAASEIRLATERFGATVVDRLRAKITIQREEPGAALAAVTPITRVGRADAEARLRGQ